MTAATPSHRRCGLVAALTASLTVATIGTTGCATFEAPPRRPTIDSRLHLVPVLAARSSFEETVADRRADPASDREATTPGDRDDRQPGRRGATQVVFWSGVVLAAVGGAGLVSFGSAGLATDRKLTRLYDEEGLTRAERETLVARGDAFNTATIVSASVGLFGALMAVTAYGIEYTQCGPLAPKRRRCSER